MAGTGTTSAPAAQTRREALAGGPVARAGTEPHPAQRRGLSGWIRAYAADVARGGTGDFDRSTTERSLRTWLWDLAAIAATIGFAFLAHMEAQDELDAAGMRLFVIVDVLSVAAACGLLLIRRRRPMTVALAVTVLASIGPGVGFAAVVAAYSAGAYGRPRAAKVAIAVLLLPTPLVILLWPSVGGDGNLWSNLTFGTLVTLGIGAWGLYAGARRELLATLQERATRAESEQALRVDQARAQERTRIAREMHDVLAHRMSLLSVHAGALEFRPDAPPEEIARAAGVIRSTAHDALEELRTVIGVMRVEEALPGAAELAPAPASPAPPQPTLAAVPQLVEEWRQAGAKIDLDLDPAAIDQLPPAIGRTAYRLVQEALTNAGKHAPTARVDVQVHGAPGGTLVVTVANPLGVGRPDSPIPGTGLGLVGLRERTELAGGAFAAGIDEDLRRFVLEARLPWQRA